MFVLLGALLIGVTLGLLGSGGSAITVPVLVYLVGHATKQSIAESMAIVGLISLAAALPYAAAKQIDWRNVWFFGLPGMLGTLAGAWLGGIAAPSMQLVVFGGVLLTAACFMLWSKAESESKKEAAPTSQPSAWKVSAEGTFVGVVTGFVGVGGGFLIVPALVLLGKLPMRLAIGTSLVIIALKSGVGFAKYQHLLAAHDTSINIATVALFVLIGIVGSFVGKSINARLDQVVLKRVFASFLILLGGFMIVQEGNKLFATSDQMTQDGSAESLTVQLQPFETEGEI